MAIKIIEESKNHVLLEIEGWDRGFCNILKTELLNDNDVKYAAVRVRHPLVSKPEMLVQTSSGDPKKAIINAAKRLQKVSEKFKSAFVKEVK